MKHYYSIANFAVGTLTNVYDYLFPIYHNNTNQQLFGQLTAYLRGPNIENTLNNLIQGIGVQNLPYNWNDTTIKYIANEYSYYIVNCENSDEWNGDAYQLISNPLVKFISDWSAATTITAGVLDTIDYYTNYNFLSWSNPIGLPNMIMKNIELSYESLEVSVVMGLGAAVLGAAVGAGAGLTYIIMMPVIIDLCILRIESLVEKYGIESIKPLNEVGVKFSDLHSHQIVRLVEKLSVDFIKPLHDAGVKFSNLHSHQIESLVEKCGIDFIKPLHEVGVKFSDLRSWQIKELVEKYGIDFIKPLHEVGAKFSYLHSHQIVSLVEKYGIESIKPLNEAGAKFSDLHSWQIVSLVKKYGVEIKDKLLHPENIQNEIMSADIYIENLTDNSLEQVYQDLRIDRNIKI